MSSRLYLRELISDRLTAAAEEIFRDFESTINVYEEELEDQRKLLKDQRKPRVAAMSSRQDLRSLIGDRLNAAAAEILRASEKTMDVYEEALERHRSMLEIVCKPGLRLHRIDLPQQPDCREEVLPDQESCSSLESTHIKEDLEEISISPEEKPCFLSHSCPEDVPLQQDCKEEVLNDQYLRKQGGNFSLDHVEPESLHMKEDDDEIPISQEEQQLVLKQEAGTLTLTLDNRERGQIDAELGGDHQLLSLSSPLVENQDQTGSKDVDEDVWQKLHDCIFQPRLKLHRLELPQVHVEDVLSHHQLCQQQENQNHQKISISQKSLSLKDRTIVLTSHHEDSDHMETETDSEQQLLSPVAERQDQTEITLRDSGSLSETQATRPEQIRQNNQQNRHQSNNRKGSKKCETCGKTFPNRYKLMQHMRIHTGEKPFSCETCGKCFNRNESRKSHMETHMRTHTSRPTGEKPKPHSCEICGKRFTEVGLKFHIKTHTDEKPFSCDICGKCFKLNEYLKIHMRTHIDEKPCLCETCEKRFRCSYQLKVHMRTHTGEKTKRADEPCFCEICGKCFSRVGNMKVHMRSHTGEKPYSCETCGRGFVTKAHRNVHTRLGKCHKSILL